jgi:phage baseplate assembly protein W
MPFDLTTKVNISAVTGFSMTRSRRQQVYQKFKTLLLTGPGERLFLPALGVGLRRLLFDGQVGSTSAYSEISSKIVEQVGIYMPYLKIEDIIFGENSTVPNAISVSIEFALPGVIESDTLKISATPSGGVNLSYAVGPVPPDEMEQIIKDHTSRQASRNSSPIGKLK